MSEPVSAAIHIQGPTIYCAELARGASGPELRHFGRRTFQFDVWQVLKDEGDRREAVHRVGAVASEELGKTEASAVSVVVSPLDAFSFFTPVAAKLSERDRMRQVIQQTALVTGTRSPDSLRITPRSVRTDEVEHGELVEWIHVLAVPRTVADRLETLLSALPMEEHVRVVSSEAAARLVGYAEGTVASGQEGTTRSYGLAIGQYPAHTEYALTHNQTWHHAHATQAARSPADRVYYAVGVLNRIDVPLRAIEHLFVYGPDANPDAYEASESLFGCSFERLDPFQLLAHSERPDEEAVGAYVPCVGAALNVLLDN